MEWRKNVCRLKNRRKGTFEFERKDFHCMERKYKLSDVVPSEQFVCNELETFLPES